MNIILHPLFDALAHQIIQMILAWETFAQTAISVVKGPEARAPSREERTECKPAGLKFGVSQSDAPLHITILFPRVQVLHAKV